MDFSEKLNDTILKKNSRLVVGLDPEWSKLPPSLQKEALERYGETLEAGAWAIQTFCEKTIESVQEDAVAVKIQLAYFELWGPPGYASYYSLCATAQEKGLLVIADGKRGDIGSTSQAYAVAHLGRVDLGKSTLLCGRADALTVNPYLGEDGVSPFLEVARKEGKGIFVLLRTSNPSSGEIQLWPEPTHSLHHHLMDLLKKWSPPPNEKTGFSPLGVVWGATYPDELEGARKKLPHSIFLIPGFGYQGGKAEDLQKGFLKGGMGALVNSSRAILYAFRGKEWEDEIRLAASQARETINRAAGC